MSNHATTTLANPRTATPDRQWIYERGGSGGVGPPVTGAAAPPVSIDPFAPDGVTPNPVVIKRSNQQIEIQVYYTLDPSANKNNYSGVAVYLEDPDISSQPPAKLDGTTTLDKTKLLSGTWNPVFENDSYSTWNGTEAHGPADFLIDTTKANFSYRLARKVRVYLASFGPNSNPSLVRANQLNPTPNVVVSLAPPDTQYVRGTEYAWLITNPQIQLEEDFNRSDPQYRMLFSYDPPDPNIPVPPGMNPFGGVEMFYAYPDAGNVSPVATITDSGVFVPMTASQGYESPVYTPGGGGKFRVYFCSGDNASPAHVNMLIPGVTPYVEVTIVYPPSGPGTVPQVADATKFTLSNPRMAPQPDGSLLAMADLSWVNPPTANYAGQDFYVTAINGNPLAPPRLIGQAGNLDTALTVRILDWPKTAQVWTISAMSEDASGRLNNDPTNPRSGTPQVNWNIGPPAPGGTGQEHVAFGGASATGANIVIDQQLSSDGVQMMRFEISGWTNPTGNDFGGTKIQMTDTANTTTWDAGKATKYVTPWQPAVTEQDLTFYFLFYSPQNEMNSLLPSSTPAKSIHFKPSPGQIIASQIPKNWFDTKEFQWPDGATFSTNIIAAGKIAVGSILRVGGAPSTSPFAPSFQGQNGQIAVYSSGSDPGDQNGTPTLRAWMGQQTTSLPGNQFGTVYGGWFSELYVGGSGPPTSPLYVRNGGVMILGGWDVQTALGTTFYPYLSVRDKTGLEKGRVGASLAANPDGSRLVPPGDIADIGGAWFTQFATGGSNLSDWKFLCPGDRTIRIRDVNRFEINYASNVAPAPPYNAPYQLLLGTDQAYTAIGTNKFPGMTLMRVDTKTGTPTSHGLTLINRGVLLGDAQAAGGQTLRAALVTYNGDPQGGDSSEPFWGILTLYSPLSGYPNVQLQSGSLVNGVASGAASMGILDGGTPPNFNFQVYENGDIFFRRQLLWGPYPLPSTKGAITLIDTTGTWVGAIKAATLTADSFQVTNFKGLGSVGQVIKSNGQYCGTSVDITPGGWVTANEIHMETYGLVIDKDGNWKGKAITSTQTPWSANIDGSGNGLYNVGTIMSGIYGSYEPNGFALVTSPSTGQPVLSINGPGIEIHKSGSAGGLPNVNLQADNIAMWVGPSYAPTTIFQVDSTGQIHCAAGLIAGVGSNFAGGDIIGASIGVANYCSAIGFKCKGGTGVDMTFATGDGRIATVKGGIITNIA